MTNSFGNFVRMLACALALSGCASLQATQVALMSDQQMAGRLLTMEPAKVQFVLNFAMEHNDPGATVCLNEILAGVMLVQEAKAGPQSALLSFEVVRIIKRNAHPYDCVQYFLALP